MLSLASFEAHRGRTCVSRINNRKQQAGAELGQAQPELGGNDLSLRGYILVWGLMATELK